MKGSTRPRRRSQPVRTLERSAPVSVRLHPGWYAAAIVLAGVLAYAHSFTTPFLFDDFGSIVRNPQIRDLSDLRRIASPPDDTSVAGRPLANLSFAVNYALGGLDVTGYHVVSLALHLLCALLLFGLVRRTLERPEPMLSRPGPFDSPDRALAQDRQAPPLRSALLAFAVALIWTVHPLNSEVVVYLSERTESMMAVCYLWTLYAGLRAVGSSRRSIWEASAVLSCAAGVACKESIATAPLMVVLYDCVFQFDSIRQAFRARWRFYGGLAASWVLLAVLIASHGDVSSGGFESAQSSTWNYLLNQTVILTRYLRLVVWPRPLVLYYGWVRPLTLGDVWPYALFIVVLLAGAIAVFVRRPKLGFPGLWVFITLAPSSSFAPIAAEVGAERRMYLPLAAIVAIAVVGSAHAIDWLTRVLPARRIATARAAAVLGFAVTLALGVSTYARIRDYESPLAMAQTVLAGWPGPTGHQLVGQELAAAGRHEEAIEHLREASRGHPPAHYFLGRELFATGRHDEAIGELETFIRDEPRLPIVPSARVLIGRAHAAAGRWTQAREQARLVLQEAPSNSEAHGLLAQALAAERQFDEAAPHYRAFLGSRPSDGSAWSGLGVALSSTGQAAEAVEAFRRAVDAEPANVTYRQNLARALLAGGDVDGAVEQVRQASVLNPNDAAAHEMFGRVLASQHKFDEARRELERALEIDPASASARELLRSLPAGR